MITTGNHVWDQKETMSHIEKENRLLRPKTYLNPLLERDLEYLKLKII